MARPEYVRITLKNVCTSYMDRGKRIVEGGCNLYRCESCPFHRTPTCEYILPNGGLRDNCEIKFIYPKNKIIIKDYNYRKD